MKLIVCLCLSLAFLSCKDSSSPKVDEKDSSDAGHHKIAAVPVPTKTRVAELLSDSVFVYRYQLTDTLKEDLNCDGFVDQVYFSHKASTKEIVFFNGKSKEGKILGSQLPVEGELGSDYSWADFWGITKDTTTWETIVKDGEVLGSRTVALKCTSIVLRKEEVGGGIITFKNGGLLWVHQAD